MRYAIILWPEVYLSLISHSDGSFGILKIECVNHNGEERTLRAADQHAVEAPLNSV